MVKAVGAQSIVYVLNLKKKFWRGYEIWTQWKEKHKKVEGLGLGEIVINSIDNDGIMKGYDNKIIDLIRQNTNLPLTVLGGVGSIVDIEKLIKRHGIMGTAAGSLFVFKGK
jgi:cyclase